MRRLRPSEEEALDGAIRAIERGRPERAWKPLRRCLESGRPIVSARAAALLADLLLARQDVDEAQRTVDGVLARLGRETGPEAHEGIMQVTIAQAMVLLARGDQDRAQDRFRTVMAEGPRDLAGLAAFNLGALLPDIGDREGARDALQAAVDSGEPKLVPRAAVNLGLLLTGTGDWAGARAAFETAVAGSDSVQAALGRFHLLLMRERHLPPDDFGTPFEEDLEALEALETGSQEWHRARKGRIAALQLRGSRMIFASLRRKDDRTRQLELYVGLLEIGERIAGLATDPGELSACEEAFQAATRIGAALGGDPGWPPGWGLGLYALRRSGDLYAARRATVRAREMYEQAYALSVTFSEELPHSVMGPYNAGRCRRKLAEVHGAAGAEPATLTSLLEEAATWSALARERQPADIDSLLEHCLSLWRLAEVAPERAGDAANRIIEDLSPLDAEEKLPPAAVEALAWARDRATGRRA
jgi:hypothetical protein